MVMKNERKDKPNSSYIVQIALQVMTKDRLRIKVQILFLLQIASKTYMRRLKHDKKWPKF